MQVSKGTEILKVLCGSRAYGLNDEDSDYDYHSIFIVPTYKMHELGVNLKAVHWQEGEAEDNTGWEIGHFLHLATHGNPTVLETFVAPIINQNALGVELRGLFPLVLCRRHIYNAFRGYAHNQVKKMLEPTAGQERRVTKAAVAYIRSLMHGEELLRTGTYDPKIKEGAHHRDFLMEIRGWEPDQVDYGRILNEAKRWEGLLTQAYEASQVQLEPNLKRISDWLVEVRYDYFWKYYEI